MAFSVDCSSFSIVIIYFISDVTFLFAFSALVMIIFPSMCVLLVLSVFISEIQFIFDVDILLLFVINVSSKALM